MLIQEVIPEEKYKRGFDRLNPDNMGEPSYDEGTRTFALSVISGQAYFEFWAGGKYGRRTATESIIWPDVTGTYYFYFDTDGVLQYALSHDITEEIFKTSALCGLCYWNAAEGAAIVQAVDEQHGILMDASTHFRLHMVEGARHMHGGGITGLVDGSAVYTSIGQNISADEDITIITPPTTTTPFIYREGVGGAWVETATPGLAIGHDGGGNTYYNLYTSGTDTWSLEAGGSATDYVIYYFVWTNDANNPVKKIVGQHAYSSRSNARDALINEVGKLKEGGFPSTETYLMFAYIVQRNGGLEDDGSGNAYVDLRGTVIFSA